MLADSLERDSHEMDKDAEAGVYLDYEGMRHIAAQLLVACTVLRSIPRDARPLYAGRSGEQRDSERHLCAECDEMGEALRTMRIIQALSKEANIRAIVREYFDAASHPTRSGEQRNSGPPPCEICGLRQCNAAEHGRAHVEEQRDKEQRETGKNDPVRNG